MATTKKSNGGKSRGKNSNGNGNGGRSKSSSGPEKPVDALDFLKSQHREVESLFSQFEKAKGDSKQFKLAQTICEKLIVHATIEEEIFYPAIRKKEPLKDLVLEADEEHLSAKRIIADVQELESGDEKVEPKITVLQEQVSHHVGEEEDEMFPKVKKVISKEERLAMGQQLQARTAELLQDEADSNNGQSPGWRATQRDQGVDGAGRSMR